MKTEKVYGKNKTYVAPEWITREYHDQITTLEQIYEALLIRYMYFHTSRLDNYSLEERRSLLTSIVKSETKFPYEAFEDTSSLSPTDAVSELKGKDLAFIRQVLNNDPRLPEIELEDFLEPELDPANPTPYLEHYSRLLAYNKQPLADTNYSQLYELDSCSEEDVEAFDKPIYLKLDLSFDNTSLKSAFSAFLNQLERPPHLAHTKELIERCIDKHALLLYDLSIWFYADEKQVVAPESDWNHLVFHKEYLETGEPVPEGRYRTILKNMALMKQKSILIRLKQIISQT